MNRDEPRKEELQKGKERCPLPEWLSTRLDVPSDLWTGGMRVDLRGRNDVVIHGCCKILDYHPDEVRLQMKTCRLSVKGVRLRCMSYLAGAVVLDGRIDSVSFEDEEVGQP